MTITLSNSDFGTTKSCPDVHNDAGADIAIYANTTHPSVTVILNGVSYVAESGNANPIQNLTLSADGRPAIVLSASWSTFRTYVGTGRGQHWMTHWTLESGTIS